MSDLPEIPDALWSLMAEIGPRWGESTGANVKLMIEKFSAVLKTSPRHGIAVVRDIAYGMHPRQQFDLYRPEPLAAKVPALLFVHGGAFVEGHRNRSPEIYANVLTFFARHGIVGLNIGYRLADDAPYPEATRDVAAVVAWVRDHADEIGVDRGKIFLMGHSAGGAHAASYTYDRRLQPASGHGLAGLIIVSGRVRADNLPENPNAQKVEAYYGTDARQYDDYSPVCHVDAKSVATFIALAEFENPLIDVYCLELAHRLAVAKRRAPSVVRLERHNHTSIIAHFNTAEEALGQAILRFIAEEGG
jgi:acetyl esterase